MEHFVQELARLLAGHPSKPLEVDKMSRVLSFSGLPFAFLERSCKE